MLWRIMSQPLLEEWLETARCGDFTFERCVLLWQQTEHHVSEMPRFRAGGGGRYLSCHCMIIGKEQRKWVEASIHPAFFSFLSFVINPISGGGVSTLELSLLILILLSPTLIWRFSSILPQKWSLALCVLLPIFTLTVILQVGSIHMFYSWIT